MLKKLNVTRFANILMCLSILCIGFGFLGIKINETNAPVPQNFLTNICRAVDVPLTIFGVVLLLFALFIGNLSQKHRKIAGDFLPYLLVAPAILFLIVFTVYPMLNIVYLSLFSGTVMNPTKKWMDINNYKSIFVIKRDFWVALKNTAVYTGATVAFLIALSLVFALWLQKDRRINDIGQTIFFTPHLVASISCAFIFQWLMADDSYGLFNTVLGLFGVSPVKWLNSADTAMGCIIFMNLWKNIGYYTLIIMSALKSIPSEIYEAAEMDNSKPLRTFFKITLPLLSPQIFLLLITITTGSFKVFDSVNIMTKGGPGEATEVLARYIYKYAFTLNKLGTASAAGVALMVILVLITAIDFKGLEKKVHYQ